MKKIYKFKSYEDDLIKNSNQDYELKDNYKWIKKSIIYQIFSYLIYYIVLIIAFVYCKLILRVKYKNRKILRDKGYFLYSNHTLTVGDVLNPFLICFPKRPFIICSPANLGIPIVGKLLPLIGALPIPGKLTNYQKFIDAVSICSKKHPIIIYPEAHLWPYYTKIRPFSTSSFHYPVDMNKPTYVATTIYQNNHIIINFEGKILIQKNYTRKENIKYLHDEVYNIMLKNSQLSDTEKYIYVEEKEVIDK